MIELRPGLFAGSNWNVPQGETYIIIDEVIARFEEKHRRAPLCVAARECLDVYVRQ